MLHFDVGVEGENCRIMMSSLLKLTISRKYKNQNNCLGIIASKNTQFITIS